MVPFSQPSCSSNVVQLSKGSKFCKLCRCYGFVFTTTKFFNFFAVLFSAKQQENALWDFISNCVMATATNRRQGQSLHMSALDRSLIPELSICRRLIHFDATPSILERIELHREIGLTITRSARPSLMRKYTSREQFPIPFTQSIVSLLILSPTP